MRPLQDIASSGDLSREEALALALDMIRESGLAGAPSALELLGRDPGLAEDPRTQEVLIEMLVAMVDAIAGGRTLEVTGGLDAATPPFAALARDLLLVANFPEGEMDANELDDASALCFAALACAAGDREGAMAFLDAQHDFRRTVDYNRASYPVRAWVMGVSAGADALWSRRVPDRLNDLTMLWREGRKLAEAGDDIGALHAFATAIVLPVADDEKRPVVEDLAIFAAYLRARGTDELLVERRILLALGANLPICQHAVVHLELADERPSWRQLPRHIIADTRDYFADFLNVAASGKLMAYEPRAGKPHVNVVWLEVTNHCNQKCTFCPDMHREDPRTWMPLDHVKRMIDQLAEGVSVGSMQLNAYGEPLIHPNIDEILAYIREKKVPWPTYFTTHGLTLVEKKLKQLSNNYPQGIAVSLHNDSQESYALTRSAKIGDYDTLVSRVSALFRQMVNERAPTHLRLYQMLSNGKEDQRLRDDVRRSFPDTADRLLAHVRKWEAIAQDIAAHAPAEAECQIVVNDEAMIRRIYDRTVTSGGNEMPILRWRDVKGDWQTTFMSTRPVSTYANLLLEYDEDWKVGRSVVNRDPCGFASKPSLAIFATGKLGICCMDLNSSATFADVADFPDIASAIRSPQAITMFAELANGVATSRGCQICLSSDTRKCG